MSPSWPTRLARVPARRIPRIARAALQVSTGCLFKYSSPQCVHAQPSAQAIPGAELRIIEGMGHDVVPQLYDVIVDAIVAAAMRARAIG